MKRTVYFLFPELNMDVGGNIAQYSLYKSLGKIWPAEVATYRKSVEGVAHLDSVLASTGAVRPIFVIHWGPDIAELLDRLAGHDVIYVAYSTGWGMKLPPHVPILAGSRNTMAYWGRHSPNSLIYYVSTILNVRPPPVTAMVRDIDVLVQERKSSHYLLQDLIPELRRRGLNVRLQTGWEDDLYRLMSRSKVYLYDSIDHWIGRGATEGFGLPPLEALCCGCTVFSSINDALADYLDPGVNCSKIRVFSTAYDADRIVQAVQTYPGEPVAPALLSQFYQETVSRRLERIMPELETFFIATSGKSTDIADPWQHRETGRDLAPRNS